MVLDTQCSLHSALTWLPWQACLLPLQHCLLPHPLPVLKSRYSASSALVSLVLSGLSWQYHALPSTCGRILVNSKHAYSIGASLVSSRHKHKLLISHNSLTMECSKLIITIFQKSPSVPQWRSQWRKTLPSAQAPSISWSSTPKSTQQPNQQGMHPSSSCFLLRWLLAKFRLPISPWAPVIS